MRVFAGLPLPSAIAGQVERWLESWKRAFRGLKTVQGGLLHITLFFFGEITESEASTLSQLMDGMRSERIRAALGALSAFPPGGIPRVIYLELERGRDAIRGAYAMFLSRIATMGYLEERRPFIPHITIGRNKSGSPLTLPEENPLKGLEFEIDRMILYESRLGRSGPAYFPLKTIFFQ